MLTICTVVVWRRSAKGIFGIAGMQNSARKLTTQFGAKQPAWMYLYLVSKGMSW